MSVDRNPPRLEQLRDNLAQQQRLSKVFGSHCNVRIAGLSLRMRTSKQRQTDYTEDDDRCYSAKQWPPGAPLRTARGDGEMLFEPTEQKVRRQRHQRRRHSTGQQEIMITRLSQPAKNVDAQTTRAHSSGNRGYADRDHRSDSDTSQNHTHRERQFDLPK